MQRLATADDLVVFDKSEPVRRAVKILSELMGSSRPVSKAEFSCVRDYIITSLLIDNATRSGAIANLTIDHVEAARKDNSTMVLTVIDHKTVAPCTSLETLSPHRE